MRRQFKRAGLGAVFGFLVAQQLFAAELVAYYPFEEGAGSSTADATGKNAVAKFMGAARFSDEGKYGSCAQLGDFEDWVDTQKQLLDTTQSYSMAAWINLDEGFEKDFHTILSQDDDQWSNFYLLYRSARTGTAPGTMGLTKWSARVDPKTDFTVHSTRPVAAGRWFHLAAVHDVPQRTVRFYLDGKLADEQTYPPGLFEWAATGHTVIGRGKYGGNPVDFFTGRIDEVYFFQGVLTGEEIGRIKEDKYFEQPIRRNGASNLISRSKPIVLDVKDLGAPISPLLFGQNLEHTRHAVWQGLDAELLANRKFAGKSLAKIGTGSPVVRGLPDKDGVAAGWHGIGKPRVKFFHDESIHFAGEQSQRIEVTEAGVVGGIEQCCIPVRKGEEYELCFWIRTDHRRKLMARISDDSGQRLYTRQSVSIPEGTWKKWRFRFGAPETDRAAKLEISFTGPGGVWIGSVSMLPADNFYGMRQDVVEKLKQMGVPLLRWPGGNFTADSRWKDGLLPVEKRPPINAICAETLPFTDNYDFQDIGIDEYLHLCDYLGAEPFLTLNLNVSVAPPQDAADWVEYCNGPSNSPYGKKRAERGHPKPWRVKYWSIGNEIWGEMGPASVDAAAYAGRLVQYATAMKKVDPSIVLVASGLVGDWDKTLVGRSGEWFDELSEHNYAPERSAHLANPKGSDYARLTRYPAVALSRYLAEARQIIDKTGRKNIGISYDEWNVWHDWFVNPFINEWRVNIEDGSFAAATLNLLCQQAQSLGIFMAAYFQPVNEGAIEVGPFTANLTPVGQVFSLFRTHSGNRVIKIHDPPMSVNASISADGRHVYATLVNSEANKAQSVNVELKNIKRIANIDATFLSAREPGKSTFAEHTERMATPPGTVIALEMPAYNILLLDISVRR